MEAVTICLKCIPVLCARGAKDSLCDWQKFTVIGKEIISGVLKKRLIINSKQLRLLNYITRTDVTL